MSRENETENKPEVCLDCPGVVCVDLETDRVAISLTKPEAIVSLINTDCNLEFDIPGGKKGNEYIQV